MVDYVESVILINCPGKINGARFTSVSYNNKFALTVANIYKETDVEREAFTRFVKMGIPVKVESNRTFSD